MRLSDGIQHTVTAGSKNNRLGRTNASKLSMCNDASSEAGPSSCPVARALCPVDHAPYRGDWLVILTAHYNEHYGLAEFGESAGTAQLDVAFSHCEALQSLPRLVFALLRSPLLQVS
eukprot:1196333-Prorocentrum_minimum.AAC.4